MQKEPLNSFSHLVRLASVNHYVRFSAQTKSNINNVIISCSTECKKLLTELRISWETKSDNNIAHLTGAQVKHIENHLDMKINKKSCDKIYEALFNLHARYIMRLSINVSAYFESKHDKDPISIFGMFYAYGKKNWAKRSKEKGSFMTFMRYFALPNIIAEVACSEIPQINKNFYYMFTRIHKILKNTEDSEIDVFSTEKLLIKCQRYEKEKMNGQLIKGTHIEQYITCRQIQRATNADTLGNNLLRDNFDVEEYVAEKDLLERIGDMYDRHINNYYSHHSSKRLKDKTFDFAIHDIINMLYAGYSPRHIKEILQISDVEWEALKDFMKRDKKVKELLKDPYYVTTFDLLTGA